MHGLLRRRHIGLGRMTLVARDLRHGELAAVCVIRAIRRLGLKVTPAMSEIISFYDYRSRGTTPPDQCLHISGEENEVGPQMKYLGLTIDNQWTFGPHFKLLVMKVTATANALCGLLPNIGRAQVGVRRLYEGVIRSWVLYGAPMWAEDLMKNRRSLLLLRRLHRTTATRTVRGCRTISYASAMRLLRSSSRP
ncbi:uncharacterized protein LOC117212616 [Bombus bifarius]|uniref:Uncharacterized protein LOC117212616 n=1 Tax=Bombus bifarius TaxID=103933 RepID=A0A6P8MI34_9HYME|nr:uncharacterized protein LOC117212616 [Bombus bifarius]